MLEERIARIQLTHVEGKKSYATVMDGFSLDQIPIGAVVGDGLRGVGRCECGESLRREHVHLRGAGLREVELAFMLEKPRVGATLAKQRRR